MQRVYHPFTLWEDLRHNFYGTDSDYDKKTAVEEYAKFLGNLEEFEAALKIIITEWKYACEHNLTNEAMNRIAYLGQAAMALKYRVPSSVSRGGYNLLSEEQQVLADGLAHRYLDIWLKSYEETLNVTKAV